jgi:hypothetical protein
VRLGCVRDREFTHWRYATRADAGYLLVLAERAGAPTAFAAYRMLTVRGVRAGFLLEFMVAPGETASGQMLLRALASWARDHGAAILSVLLPGSGPTRASLREEGFHRIPEVLHPKLIRFSVRGLGAYSGHPLLTDSGAWFMSWGDTDIV